MTLDSFFAVVDDFACMLREGGRDRSQRGKRTRARVGVRVRVRVRERARVRVRVRARVRVRVRVRARVRVSSGEVGGLRAKFVSGMSSKRGVRCVCVVLS